MTQWLPVQASSHAAEIDGVMGLVHLLMLGLFVGWSAYFVWVLIRFRRGRQPQANPAGARGRAAFYVEVAVVVAEVVLLVVFALPLWYQLTAGGDDEHQSHGAPPLTLRVVAEQFIWNVHYPGADGQFGTTSASRIGPDNPLGLDRTSPHGADDLMLLGDMHLPINRRVQIQLSSKDVIHSFGVPAMRVKLDAIPGVVTPLHFTPTREGQFDIACSQLCGVGHHRMRGVITVESEAAFAKWLAAEAALVK
jgi:cytochrome c oxidase subunit 2